jgi:ADP-L-glycero-D-manno-heptose 6-epimerase
LGQKRDFVFVEDCITHLLWLWQHPYVCGLFNSGTGHARTFNEMVLAVCTALGRPPRIRYIDMPTALRCRYQHFTQAGMSKLYRAGFSQPPTDLETGVQQFLAATHARLPHPSTQQARERV